MSKGKFDAAIHILAGERCMASKTEGEQADLWVAIRVLEEAGKVDKAKSIGALNGYFAFLSIHGFTETDPLVVSVYALLEALPDEEPT